MMKTVKTTSLISLHVRPAAAIVSLARQFQSSIVLIPQCGNASAEYSAKDVLRVMMARILPGTTVLVKADGPDCEEAAAAIAGFLENKDNGME